MCMEVVGGGNLVACDGSRAQKWMLKAGGDATATTATTTTTTTTATTATTATTGSKVAHGLQQLVSGTVLFPL
jgi:hypothetical protein